MNLDSEAAQDSKREKWRSADVKTEENINFSSLLLPDRIQRGLKNCGFEKPSPVQLQAIPLGRCGIDLVVQAKSGTGKTCVMAVIALDSLMTDLPNTQVLVLAPTREIASQVCGVIRELGYAFPNLTCETFIGGLPVRLDKANLPLCQIVVGTPGRIKQLIDMGILQTESIRLFVVDEADKLFDRQFREDMNWIFSSLPSRKQILALSATYPNELSKFLSLYMESPVYVRINSKDPALLGIIQCFRITPYHPMLQVADTAKFDVLLDILNSITFSQCMIFCQRQTKAQDLADNLVLKGFPSLAICSALDQVTRLEIIQDLKTFQCRVLVSTDLTARGIDAENVDLVINFEIPYEAETYLHRIGRAGRYGTRGMAISLASDGDELKRLKKFQKKFLFKIYKLPDQIPVDLWDTFMTLQTSELEREENGCVLLNSNGADKANDPDYSTACVNSTHKNKLDQSLSINQSDTTLDQSRKNVGGTVYCDNNTAECDENEVLNSCVLSDNLGEIKIIVNETTQMINKENKAEEVCESEFHNLDISSSLDQVECQKCSDVQSNHPAESKLKSNGYVKANTSVENGEVPVEKSIDKDNKMCVPKEVGVVANVEEEKNNFVSSHELNLCSAGDLNEELNNGQIVAQVEKSLTAIIKTDSPMSMDSKESECKSEITNDKGKGNETMQSKIVSCPLFKKWEKYLQGNEGNIDFSDKEVSDIVEALISTSNARYSESSFAYDELVRSWECRSDHSMASPVQHCPKTSASCRSNIPQTQVEIIQKYIYQNKCKFFSSVQKLYEMKNDCNLCERETSIEAPSDISVSSGNLNTLSACDDEEPASQSVSTPESKNIISHETSGLNEGDELLKNGSCSDFVVITTECEDHCEINASGKDSADVVCESVDTCKESCAILPDSSAIEPPAETDTTVRNQFLPFCGNKSMEQAKTDSSPDKHSDKSKSSAHYFTEAVYNSVICGIKQSKIVLLPPVPSDHPKNSTPVTKKESACTSIFNERPVIKNQGVKKKVRGISKKHKQKNQEKVNSAQVSSVEPNAFSKSDVVEENYLPSLAYKEMETGKSKKYVDFSDVSQKGPEKRQRVDHKKRGKVTTGHRQKSKLYSPNAHEVEVNPEHYPPSFGNDGMDGYCSPCVAFASHYICCCRLPHVQQSDSYYQSPVPFQNMHPQYYYQKFLEQWYYIQELTYSYYRY